MERAVKTKTMTFLAAASASALVLTGCTDTGAGSGKSTGTSVAVLLASTQNAYNQAVLAGVEEVAKEAGVELKVLDGQFDSNVQLSQLENLQASQFDGVVVLPNDGVSLASAFPLAGDLPVVTVTNPIGPDILAMQSQVEGVISTVGISPDLIGQTQAEDVVEYCADRDPCKVVQVVGFTTAPLDVAILAAYERVFGKHDNIEVVGTVEGEYDRDKALTAVSNVLQANPDVDVFLSNTDQQTSGIIVALEAAGVDPAERYVTGTGGTTEAIDGVRAGTWKSTYAAFPVQRGAAALTQLLNHLAGESVEESVNADELGSVPAWITADVLARNEDFQSDWNG